MKKTISITLNGLVFNIEEDAYDRLKNYLDGLKRHFDTVEYGGEVISDIESRIAEQFSGKVTDRKKESVNLSEVEEVIKTMGSVEDLTGDKGATQKTESPGSSRRLYRNPDDLIIAGVAGGIASYFHIDPILPRLFFVAITLAGGSGILLYIILWIIVPEAKSGAEKLEMKGNPVTVANLEESHKENSDRKKNFSVIAFFFRELFYLLGRFIRALIPIILSIIGLVMTAVAFVCLFAFTLLMIVMLFNPDSTYVDPAIAQVFNGGQYVMLVISGYISAIIPVIVALLLGITFVRRKSVFTGTLIAVFSILWLSSALTFGFLAVDSAPQVQAAVKSIEERPNQSKEFQVSGFDSIETERDHQVKIVHGSTTRVVAYGEQNKLNRVRMEVIDNALVISEEDDDFRICLFCITRPVTVEITTPVLETVDANNASNVEILGFSNVPRLNLEAHGASRIKFDGSVQVLGLDLGSAARITLNGSADQMNAELSNASRLDAENFRTRAATIQAYNSSRADLQVLESLRATASGASRINYTGNPTTLELIDNNAAEINSR